MSRFTQIPSRFIQIVLLSSSKVFAPLALAFSSDQPNPLSAFPPPSGRLSPDFMQMSLPPSSLFRETNDLLKYLKIYS